MTVLPWFDPTFSPDLEQRIARVTQQLRISAVERDQLGSAPHEEAGLLKQAGLTGLTLQPFADGIDNPLQRVEGDDRWRTALNAVRRVARADLSAAALLGYNYMTLWRIEAAGDTEVFKSALQSTLGSGAIWGGTNNPKGPVAQLTKADGGYHINGRKTFATGSQSADFIVIGEALQGETKRLNFALPANTPGLSHGDDWTAFGARRSASGSILFDNVFVPESAVFRSLDMLTQSHEVIRSSGSLSFQILFVNMLVGAAQGAIELALDYLRRRGGRYDSREESYIPEIIGELIARTHAAAALADRANEAFADLTLDRYRQKLAAVEKGVLGDRILQAKIIADRTGLDVATRVIEATGARSATREEGLDLIWRDIRVYTLHDPVAMRSREVGTFWLGVGDEKRHDELGVFHTL
jgi:alkylation response protein AidB-like acyl-CoA dehydrogenase